MGDQPLSSPIDHRLGEPLPHQLANHPHAHPQPPEFLSLDDAVVRSYGVLIRLSASYPPVEGRLHTCYAPLRHSRLHIAIKLAVRLACIRLAASVHPEPGSNSP